MDLKLKGKIALVTGVSEGIGKVLPTWWPRPLVDLSTG
jgi:hypothetical protein